MKILVICETKGKKNNGLRVADALTLLGHEVRTVPPVAAADRIGGSELVLMTGNVVSLEHVRPGSFGRIRAAVPKSVPLVLWYFDLCSPAMKHSPWKFKIVRGMAPRLDLLAMTDHSWSWEAVTPRFLHLLQGVDQAEFAAEPAPYEPRSRDVIFTGGTEPPFHDRLDAIKLIRRYRHSVAVYGRSSPHSIFGAAFWAEHQKAKCVFVPTPPRQAPARYWSNRVYLATATGTPCVVGWTEGLDAHFQDGRDVLFFSSPSELMAAVELLIHDPGARERIGRAGRIRTLADHTYQNRALDLLAAIFPKE